MMPKTSVELPGLDVFFYSNEHKPRHVHVTNGDSEAVFEFMEPTGPLTLRENNGFSRKDLNRIKGKLEPHVTTLWEDWEEHFGQHETDH